MSRRLFDDDRTDFLVSVPKSARGMRYRARRNVACQFLLAATLVLLANPAASVTAKTTLAKTTMDGSWWVVLGSFADPEAILSGLEAVSGTAAAAKRCGFETMSDFSVKFDGFAPGYQVVVIGGFLKQAEADVAAMQVRSCVPAAYVKRSKYAGE